jgi:hypothetical protein
VSVLATDASLSWGLDTMTRMKLNEVGLRERLDSRLWNAARAGLALISLVALVSFGGQVFFAPILLPLQWLVARNSGHTGRIFFSALAALLIGELAWMGGYLISGELLGLLAGVAAGVVGGALFYRSTGVRAA